MRVPLAAWLLVALGSLPPIRVSLPVLPEDLEGSGYGLDFSGSGEDLPGEMKNMEEQENSKDGGIVAVNAGGGNKNSLHGSSDWTFGPGGDTESGFVIISNSKSVMENQDILAATIAGGVMGVTVAATLAGILIYKLQKKDEERSVLG